MPSSFQPEPILGRHLSIAAYLLLFAKWFYMHTNHKYLFYTHRRQVTVKNILLYLRTRSFMLDRLFRVIYYIYIYILCGTFNCILCTFMYTLYCCSVAVTNTRLECCTDLTVWRYLLLLLLLSFTVGIFHSADDTYTVIHLSIHDILYGYYIYI